LRDPFLGMNFSGNTSPPRKTGLRRSFAIESGTPDFQRVKYFGLVPLTFLLSAIPHRGAKEYRLRPRQVRKSDSRKSTISVMAPMLASTRSAFFQQYNFDLDPRATLHTEFRRLAESRKWKQGSNSKIFEKAWNQCFGSEVPVAYNIDRIEDRVGAQYSTDNEDFSSMLRSLQSLDLEGGTNKKAKVRRVGTEFASHYGSDAGVKEKWQALCQDCGVNPVPPSISQCKKVQPLQRCARRDSGSRIHANVSCHSLGTQRSKHQHLSFP